MKELASIDFQRHKWRISILTGLLVIVVAGSFWLNTAPFRSGFEITDELGGNIFPSSILSVATTDAQVIVPSYYYMFILNTNLLKNPRISHTSCQI